MVKSLCLTKHYSVKAYMGNGGMDACFVHLTLVGSELSASGSSPFTRWEESPILIAQKKHFDMLLTWAERHSLRPKHFDKLLMWALRHSLQPKHFDMLLTWAERHNLRPKHFDMLLM
jgi:hypothetical protein